MKTYNYMGLRVQVQDWVTYIGMDKNLLVYGFRNTPSFDTDADEWVFPAAADYHLVGSLHQISGIQTSLLTLILSL